MQNLLLILSISLLIIGCKQKNRNEIVVPVKYEGKFGFIDRKGEWFIEPRFDSVSNFWAGYASVYKDGKEGIINTWGQQIVDCKYDFVGLFESELALIRLNDSVNYLNTSGDLISKTNFFDGEDFSEGLAAVQFEYEGKWGYINSEGEIQIEPSYDYGQEFKNGVALVDKGDFELQIDKSGVVLDTVEFEPQNRKFPIIGNANNWTLGKLNSQGDTIMEMKYRSFGHPQGDKMWFFTGENYGLADTTGTMITEPVFEKLWYFADNGLALAKQNGLYGFIDRTGITRIPFRFQETSGFKHGLAAVKLDGKWGFIDSSSQFVIKPKFDIVAHYFRSTLNKREWQYIYEDQ